jgi:hypothetical protein
MAVFMISRTLLVISILVLAACGGGGSEDGGSSFIPQAHIVQSNELVCVEYTPNTQQEQNDIQSQGGYPGSCSRSETLGQCEYFSHDNNLNVRLIYYPDASGLLTVGTLSQACEHLQGSFSEINHNEDSDPNTDPSNPDLEIPPVDMDSDNDGFADFIEIEYGTATSDWSSNPSAILSKSTNFVDDNDNDGFPDYLEAWFYTDPNDPNSKPVDNNSDSIPDDFDANSDTDAPKLLGFDIYEESLVIETGLETLTLNISVVDDISGVRSVAVVFASDGPQNVYVSIYGEQLGNKVHALSLDTSEFGEYAYSGEWRVSEIRVEDIAGNGRNYSADDLEQLGFQHQVSVENDLSDTAAPSLNSFSIVESEIEVLTGLEAVNFNLNISDDVSGIERVDLVMSSPSNQSIYVSLYGDSLGLLQHKIALESSTLDLFATAGVWTVEYLAVEDKAGNRFSFDAQQLTALGFDSSVIVTNSNVDSQNPVLEEFSFSESFISIDTGQETVTFNLRVTDDISGLDRVKIDLVSPTGKTVHALIHGADLGETVHQMSLESSAFGELADEGEWVIQSVLLTDIAGNSQQYLNTDLEGLGFDANINVYNF